MVWVWPTMPKRGAADNRDAAVTLVLAAGDQGMHRRLEPERRGVGGNVVHPPVGDQERAGDAIDRNVRERRSQRTEQMRAVGFAVGLAGLDHADFKPLDLLQLVDQRLARLLGLLGAIAEILARAFVDHDHRDRRQRLAILAGERRIGERERDQRQGCDPHRRAARRGRAAARPRSRRWRRAPAKARARGRAA